MDRFDDEGRTDPSDLEVIVRPPHRSSRPPRPIVFDRRADEEQTLFMDRSNSPRSEPPPSSRPSQPPAPSPRGARSWPQGPRILLDEPTVYKPVSSPKAPPSSRRSSAPPAAPPTPSASQAIMSWPADTARPRQPAARRPSHATTPRPATAPKPAPPSTPSPRPRTTSPRDGDESLAAVLFAAPDPRVIVPETLSTAAVVKDRGFQSDSGVVIGAAQKKAPLFMLASGFGLLGTLFAFAAVVGVASLLRSTAPAVAAAGALHPAVVMTATPLAVSPPVPASDPVGVAPPAVPAAQPLERADRPPVQVAARPAPRPSRPVVHTPPPAPAVAPAPPPTAAPVVVAAAAVAPTPAPAAAAPPPAPALAADAPKAHKGKATKADLDDAKAADELARAQLEASLR